MGIIAVAIIAVEVLVILGVIGLLIYFIIKRREDRKNENFERRDN